MVNLLTLLLAAQAASPRIALAPCGPELPGAQCGKLEVFENRASRTGRKIALNVVVLPASGSDRAPDPVFFFAGGPGEAITRMAPGLVGEYGKILERRDIVLVDQRGTGGSHPLNCDLFRPPDDPQSYLGDFFPPAAVRDCRTKLEKDADLTQYVTSIAMDDIDDVRAALGYDRINLWGGSYGTRAALVYMRRHPDHVRTATLMGVVPPTDPMPLRLPQDAQRALDGIVADCAADAACRGAFPELATELKTVLAGLSKGPAKANVLDPETGETRTVSLSRDLVNETLRYLMYESGYASLIPVLVHSAAQGDFDAIAELALFWRRQIVGSAGIGLYLSITCAEDVPWIKPGAGERAAAGTFLGDYRLVQQRRACTLWPQAKVPASDVSPVSSSAPVLILSGQWDPTTPPALGDVAARTLPASLHVVVPHGGHSYDGLQGVECIPRLNVEFVERGTAKGLDTSCVAGIKRAPMPTALPPMKPIALAEAEVAKLAGKWVGDGVPMEVTVEAKGSKLKFTLSPERQFLLVPVSPTRFRATGALGLYAVVELEEGKAKRIVLEENGSAVMALKPADH